MERAAVAIVERHSVSLHGWELAESEVHWDRRNIWNRLYRWWTPVGAKRVFRIFGKELGCFEFGECSWCDLNRRYRDWCRYGRTDRSFSLGVFPAVPSSFLALSAAIIVNTDNTSFNSVVRFSSFEVGKVRFLRCVQRQFGARHYFRFQKNKDGNALASLTHLGGSSTGQYVIINLDLESGAFRYGFSSSTAQIIARHSLCVVQMEHTSSLFCWTNKPSVCLVLLAVVVRGPDKHGKERCRYSGRRYLLIL